ncbi:hypothetical protein [Leucobacter sp. Z1108]
MTPAAEEGLSRLLDLDREGPLDAGEVAALASSRALRPWVLLAAASYGAFALGQLAEGRDAGTLADWFGTLRAEIAEKIVQVAR